MALGLAEYERRDPRTEPPQLVGAIVAVTFIALFVGFGSAMFLRDQSVGVAWAVAALIGLALSLATRSVSNGSVTRLPLLLWAGLAVGLFAYLMVVGVESIPRTQSLGLWLLMAVSIFAGACAAPVLIILRSGRRVPVPRDLLAPPLITAALAWCSAILWLIALLIIYSATLGLSPVAQIVSVLIAAIGVPVVSAVPWTYAYERIIRWWAVDPPPQLTHALDVLASRSGFRFDRVVCLQALVRGRLQL